MIKNKVSIVMELENATLTTSARFVSILDQLIIQANQLFNISNENEKNNITGYDYLQNIKSPIDLIASFNQQHKHAETINALTSYISDRTNNISVKIISAPQLKYFDLKNFGGSKADSDIIIFLDSDVIPQPNWLITLLGSFSNQEVGIVGSVAYVEQSSLYSKSYALIKFNLPPESNEIIPSYDVPHGNSLAFRKLIFDKFNFPPTGESYKLAFKYFADKLKSNGIVLYANTASRVEHPAPLLKNFFKRAFFHGRDEMILRQDNRSSDKALKFLYTNKTFFGKNELRLAYERFVRIIKNYQKVRLTLIELPFALLIITGYYIAMAAGYLSTMLLPKLMRSNKLDYLTMAD